jgi:hypothetical protein
MAEHDPNVAFIGWLGDGASCGESASCSVTMSSARTVVAKFGASGTAVWVTKAGGTAFDTTDHVTVDASDYVITAGKFESDTLVDGSKMLVRSFVHDGYVAKKSPVDGSTIWMTDLGCSDPLVGVSIASVATDPVSGDVYVAGTISGTCAFPAVSPLVADGFDDFFVARLRGSDGAIVSARRLPVDTSEHVHLGIDGQGLVYVAGSYSGSIDLGSGAISASTLTGFLAKYDPSNNYALEWPPVTWAATGNSNFVDVAAVRADSSNNVVVAGSFRGTLGLGSNPPSSTSSDAYVAKFSGSNGTLAWVHGYGGPLDDDVYSLAIGPSNDVLVAGKLDYGSDGTQQIDFGLGPLVGSGDKWEIFVARLSTIGELKWAQRFGGPGDQQAFAVGVSGSKIVFGGQFFGSLTVGDFTINHFSQNGADAYAGSVAYDDGTGTWLERISSANDETVTTDAAVSHEGNAILVGYFAGVTQFADTDLTSSGTKDGFCVEIAPK